MTGKWFPQLSAAMLIAMLILVDGCGHDRKLVSIAVQPPTVFFLTPDSRLNFQLTALGTYIHPPETIDITNTVVWKSDSTGLVTIDKAGVVAPAGNGECGIANITASSYTSSGNTAGNVVLGTATITVHNPAVPTCP